MKDNFKEWFLIYLGEQNVDMAMGTKDSGYVNKFFHWRFHGVEEVIY